MIIVSAAATVVLVAATQLPKLVYTHDIYFLDKVLGIKPYRMFSIVCGCETPRPKLVLHNNGLSVAGQHFTIVSLRQLTKYIFTKHFSMTPLKV